MFEICWVDGDILNVRMSGFFSLGEMKALEAETEHLLRQKPAGPFFGLAEISPLPVQRPDVVFRLRDLLSTLRTAGMANGAMVVQSMLVKLQTRRAVDTGRAAYFDNQEDAVAWLATRRDAIKSGSAT